MIEAGEPVSAATAALEAADAALVLDDGKPVGVLTRQDLLGFLAERWTRTSGRSQRENCRWEIHVENAHSRRTG